ncbi:MAG: xanthine dehydrogenase family protein molybdopterin-binding subunit [Gammaproteobacteria bacterium]|nr:xanthine dehydrogenase family protein molybdopterin-binding subunit [Gammaproteobacteria bacterium]
MTERDDTRVIGRAVPRLEDPDLLRGAARFVDDVDCPGLLHAAVLRSAYAHGRLGSLDVSAARAMPGVAAVLTHEEIGGRLRPIPIRLCPDPALNDYLQRPLAADRVRYVGEPLALVVAESRARAEDAMGEIDYDIDPLPACTDAMAPPPAALFEQAPDNLAALDEQSFGDVAGAFAEADHVVRSRFESGRHSGIPMETRGLVADYDDDQQRLHIWGSTKVTHFNRGVLAAMLDWPEERIHLAQTEVGGGFGVRGEFYPEDFLVPFAALTLGRPVKWIEDRMEHLAATNHSRQQYYELELALRNDGRLLGLRARITNDMGAYLRTHGTIVPGLSAGMLPGPYRLDSYHCEARAVLTNKTPTGTYRAPGRFECNAARERLMDLAAAELGIDRVELRRRNLLTPADMPYERGTHILGEEVIYDSGDYPAALERALTLSDWQRRGARPASADGRRRRGLGLACFVEKTGKGPYEGARVRLEADGSVTVATGAASVGQGLQTCLAQIAAEVLGVAPGAVTVHHGDTDLIGYGVGTFASRATVMAGSAVQEAASELRRGLLEHAAARLGVPAERLALSRGGLRLDGAPRMSLAELMAGDGCDDNGPPPSEAEHRFELDHMTYSYGVTVAEVEVDVLTGAVRPRHVWIACDVGRVINPRIVAGQIEGGAAQGVGGALLEAFQYDEEGQLLTGSFQEYLLPTSCDVPPIAFELMEDTPSTLNPLGVKGWARSASPAWAARWPMRWPRRSATRSSRLRRCR